MLNLSSLSTQSLASCVNYFVWNCFKCFSNTKIGSVTSFSILFNFQGPVAPQPTGWRLDYFTTEVIFCQAFFSKRFERFELGPLPISQNWLESFSVYWFFSFASQLGLQKSFFCLSAWRSSIIPYPRPDVNTFLQVFSSFLKYAWGSFISPARCFFLLVFCHISSLNWRSSFFFLFSDHFSYIM